MQKGEWTISMELSSFCGQRQYLVYVHPECGWGWLVGRYATKKEAIDQMRQIRRKSPTEIRDMCQTAKEGRDVSLAGIFPAPVVDAIRASEKLFEGMK